VCVGLGRGLGWTPALSARHIVAEAAYDLRRYVSAKHLPSLPDSVRQVCEICTFWGGTWKRSLCRTLRHERIKGVTVSRNRAIQIDIYLLTCFTSGLVHISINPAGSDSLLPRLPPHGNPDWSRRKLPRCGVSMLATAAMSPKQRSPQIGRTEAVVIDHRRWITDAISMISFYTDSLSTTARATLDVGPLVNGSSNSLRSIECCRWNSPLDTCRDRHSIHWSFVGFFVNHLCSGCPVWYSLSTRSALSHWHRSQLYMTHSCRMTPTRLVSWHKRRLNQGSSFCSVYFGV